MNLSDQKTLELTALCDALVDGTITTAAREQLTQLLAESAAGREFYVRFMELSASLYHYAAELQIDASVGLATSQPAWWSCGVWWAGGALAAAAAALFLIWFGNFPAHEKPMVIAHVDHRVLQPGGVKNNPVSVSQGQQGSKPDRTVPDNQADFQQRSNPIRAVPDSQAGLEDQPRARQTTAGVEESPEFVAQVIGAENCRWGGKSMSLKPDDQLQSGQRLKASML